MGFNIVIVGYSQMFAAVIKGVLASGNKVVGIFRNEQIKRSKLNLLFKNYFNPEPDYSYIKKLKLYEINANSVNSEQFRQELIKLKTDILIVASWSEKFSKETIMIPRIACINTHPSFLPKYRGPNPYLQVIKNQEKFTGVTFHLMDEKFDSGAILTQYKVPILPNDTGKVLRMRCASTVQTQLPYLLRGIEENTIVPISQNEAEATYYPQITIEDILIDFNLPSEKISAQIRSISDWQHCYFLYKGMFIGVKQFKIYKNIEYNYPIGYVIKHDFNKLSICLSEGDVIEFINPIIYNKLLYPFSRLCLKYFIGVGETILSNR